KSTGEVMGIARDFDTAFGKALVGAGMNLPQSGTAFVSVKDGDKDHIVPAVEKLIELGFKVIATGGTAAHLQAKGLPVETVNKVPMLEEGHRKLNDDLKRLKMERPEIVEAIEAARAHGDLSENAEYHAAKERQGQIEATIADLEDKLSRAMVIDPTTLSGDKVVFGATVTLIDEDEKQVKYQLVGQTEADARVGRIS